MSTNFSHDILCKYLPKACRVHSLEVKKKKSYFSHRVGDTFPAAILKMLCELELNKQEFRSTPNQREISAEKLKYFWDAHDPQKKSSFPPGGSSASALFGIWIDSFKKYDWVEWKVNEPPWAMQMFLHGEINFLFLLFSPLSLIAPKPKQSVAAKNSLNILL